MQNHTISLKRCIIKIWLLCCIFLLVASTNSFADDFKNTKEHDVIWSNLSTSLYTLTDAVNNPKPFAIENLNRILISDSMTVADFNKDTQEYNLSM